MAGSTGQPTMAWMPFVGVKATSGDAGTRTNDSLDLAMGRWSAASGAINNEWTVDLYFDSVTWKYAQVHLTQSDVGIYTIQLDGVTQGTIDGYNAGTVRNNYSEITGLTLTTASVKTFKVLMATKNASSSNYRWMMNSVAWIATSQTGASTPGGTDTPGYTWEWIPWMGAKTDFTSVNRNQGVDRLGGGYVVSNGSQNEATSTDKWNDTGTHTVALIHRTLTNNGIYSITGLNGTQTIDGYGADTQNVYSAVTGIAIAAAGVATFTITMASKNASSSNYQAVLNSGKVIRTGA